METLPIDEIKQFFASISRPTVKTLCTFVLLIRNAKTVNFNFMKDEWSAVTGDSEILTDSIYKKIIRFFNHDEKAVLCNGIGLWLAHLFVNQYDMVLIDRTHWKWGEKEINLLTLSILWQGVSIPIAWVSLDKAGNSSQAERIELFQNVLTLFDLKGKTVLADREFLGENWFAFLSKQKIHFIVRLKSKAYFKEIIQGSEQSYESFCEKARKSKEPVHCTIQLKGFKYTFVALKNPNPNALFEDRIIFYLSDWSPSLANEICEAYRLRWKIESMFKHLKSNGFNFDQMHLKDDEKIELLVGIVALGYACAVSEGIKEAKKNPIKLKFYRKTAQQFPAKSIFRLGLSQLKRFIWNRKHFISFLIQITSCPPIYVPVKSVQ